MLVTGYVLRWSPECDLLDTAVAAELPHDHALRGAHVHRPVVLNDPASGTEGRVDRPSGASLRQHAVAVGTHLTATHIGRDATGAHRDEGMAAFAGGSIWGPTRGPTPPLFA